MCFGPLASGTIHAVAAALRRTVFRYYPLDYFKDKRFDSLALPPASAPEPTDQVAQAAANLAAAVRGRADIKNGRSTATQPAR